MGCTQQIIPALYQFQYKLHTCLITSPKNNLGPQYQYQAGIKVLNQTQYQDQVDIRVWKQTQYQVDQASMEILKAAQYQDKVDIRVWKLTQCHKERAGIEILKAAQYQDQAGIFNSWYPSNTNLYTTVPTAHLMFGTSLPNIYLFIYLFF
jgi:hypothetical protein